RTRPVCSSMDRMLYPPVLGMVAAGQASCGNNEIAAAAVGCGENGIAAVELVKEPPCHRRTRVRAVVTSPELSRNQ
ncbi:hypothetical protein A2U01_0057846, partial [Trifolium medium]|nr:hypothetical protein [Trifolium medium]